MILEINLTWSRMVLILSRGFISLKHVSNGICDYNTCNFILFYRNCTVSVQPRIRLNACAIDIEVKWRQKRSKKDKRRQSIESWKGNISWETDATRNPRELWPIWKKITRGQTFEKTKVERRITKVKSFKESLAFNNF